MPRHLLKAALLCAFMAIPAVAQERVHLPEPGQTDEWCLTPIVWTGQSYDQALEELRAVQAEAARSHGYLGVDLGELTDARAKELKVDGAKGALVERVLPGSPAEKAGLETNDVVVSVDGRAVASGDALREVLGDRKPGDKVAIEVVRGGRRQKLEATLGSRSSLGDYGVFAGPEGYELFRGRMPDGFRAGEPYVMMFPGQPRLGVSVLPMTDELREYFGVERGKGVLVSAVSKGSAADRAGLRAGDVVLTVDGQPVSRAGDVSRALRSKEGDAPRTVQIEIVRDRSRQTLSATVEAPKLMNEE